MLHGCNYTGVILPRQWHKRKGDLGFGATFEPFGRRKKPLTCENSPVFLGFANFPGRKKLTKISLNARKGLGPQGISAGSTPSKHLSFVVQKVDQHVVAQVLWGRKEGPSAVQLAHLFDELTEVRIRVEHEGVDDDVLFGTQHHLTQCGIAGFGPGRIIKENLTIRHHMGSGFAVSDHDDLLGTGLLRQQASGDHEALVHVGAVIKVP